MHNPPENLNDAFVSTFEKLMNEKHEVDINDKKLREEIKRKLEGEAKPTHVSSDQ